MNMYSNCIQVIITLVLMIMHIIIINDIPGSPAATPKLHRVKFPEDPIDKAITSEKSGESNPAFYLDHSKDGSSAVTAFRD